MFISFYFSVAHVGDDGLYTFFANIFSFTFDRNSAMVKWKMVRMRCAINTFAKIMILKADIEWGRNYHKMKMLTKCDKSNIQS